MNRDPKAWERLGRLISDARVQRDLSRAELAELADVADRSVYSAEVGYGKKPPLRVSPPPTLIKIVVALGWTPESIQTVLSGGNPIPADQMALGVRLAESATPPGDRIFTDPRAQAIWELDLPVEERVRGIQALMEDERRRREDDERRREEELKRAIDAAERRRSAG